MAGSKCFICDGMDSNDSIMAMKDPSRFTYVPISWFLGQFKDNIFMFKMFVDLARNGVDLVKHMQSGCNM